MSRSSVASTVPHHRSNNSSSNNNSSNKEENDARTEIDPDEFDLEGLRRVFGSASPEDLNNRKAHELRELWLESTAESNNVNDKNNNDDDNNNDNINRRLPRFLLDPKDEDHIPPHAVALNLLLGGGQQQHHHQRWRKRSYNNSTMLGDGDGDGLYRRVGSTDSGDASGQNSTIVTNYHCNNDNLNVNDARSENEKDEPPRTGRTGRLLVVGPLVVIALVSLACRFVLEVLGGAGAIWGCTELLGLRTGGPGSPSGEVCAIAAGVVGVLCLLRFLLVACSCGQQQQGRPQSFAQKHGPNAWLWLLASSERATIGRSLDALVELAPIVAGDPVLFLHPTRGPLASSLWCRFGGCCYCECCGIPCGRKASGDVDPGGSAGAGNTADRGEAPCSSSPLSLSPCKPPPKRGTWEMSDDDDDDDNRGGSTELVASGP